MALLTISGICFVCVTVYVVLVCVFSRPLLFCSLPLRISAWGRLNLCGYVDVGIFLENKKNIHSSVGVLGSDDVFVESVTSVGKLFRLDCYTMFC